MVVPDVKCAHSHQAPALVARRVCLLQGETAVFFSELEYLLTRGMTSVLQSTKRPAVAVGLFAAYGYGIQRLYIHRTNRQNVLVLQPARLPFGSP